MINFRTFLSFLKETPNSRIPPYVCPAVWHLETTLKNKKEKEKRKGGKKGKRKGKGKKKNFFIWILIVYIFNKVEFRKHKFKALCSFSWFYTENRNKQTNKTTWQRKRLLSSEPSAEVQGTRSGVWVQRLLSLGPEQ